MKLKLFNHKSHIKHHYFNNTMAYLLLIKNEIINTNVWENQINIYRR